jgi:hypothetical protein
MGRRGLGGGEDMHGDIGANWALSGAAAWQPPSRGKGFTDTDLKMLHEVHRSGTVNRGWGRAQFVVSSFAQYFAIWGNDLSNPAEPTVSIVRFDKTGTYALLLDNKFIASGKSLGEILPTLAAVGSFARERQAPG